MLEEVISKIEKAPELNSNILPHSDKSGNDYIMGDMYDPLTRRDVWMLDEYVVYLLFSEYDLK